MVINIEGIYRSGEGWEGGGLYATPDLRNDQAGAEEVGQRQQMRWYNILTYK